MGFIGVFLLLAVVVWIIVGLFLFIFVPCLVISIVNLVQGIKHHWPKRNIIPLAITGSVVVIITLLCLWLFMIYSTNKNDPSSSEEVAYQAVNQIYDFIQMIK